MDFVLLRQMGNKKIGLLFLVVLLLIASLCSFASASPLHDSLLSDRLKKKNNLGVTGTYKHDINSVEDDSDKSSMTHSRKFAHGAVTGGEHGGGADGAAAGAVPVIVAGAASNHHPKKKNNAGSRHVNCLSLPALITTSLAVVIVY